VAELRRQAFDMLPMSEVDVRRALEVQALLAEHKECGVPWPALLVAAIAERCGVTVLHCEPCYDVIVKVTAG
jgi:predicted nucleic acid-binding protein